MPLKNIIITAILGLAPISELRGAIPYAFFSGIPIIPSFLLGVLFNTMVPFLAYFFLNKLNNIFLKMHWYTVFFDKYIEHTRKKLEPIITKYGYWGLMLFVGIPLPITGAWTGTIGAWLLKMKKGKSILFIFLGLLISGIIVTVIIITGIGINSILIKKI